MLKQYRQRKADNKFWTKHWGSISVEQMLKGISNNPRERIFMKYLPKGKILEGGCGLGQWVIYLSSLGYNIEGVDFSKETIKKIKDYMPDAPVKVGDVTSLDYPDNYFDAYISLGVAEHFPEGPDLVLREAHRVLKNGGLIVYSVPYMNLVRKILSPFEHLKERKQKKKDCLEFYQYAFSKMEVLKELFDFAFTVIYIDYYDVTHTLITKSRLIKIVYNYLRKKLTKLQKTSINLDTHGFINNSRIRNILASLTRTKLMNILFANMIFVVAKRSDLN